MPKVTISGSFKRDPEGLAKVYADLTAAGCDILSPLSAIPVRAEDGFIFMQGDELDKLYIERRHLASISQSHFVWLHAPNGYVGPSAAMEIGWAVAQGIQVFSTDTPSDPILQDMVTTVPTLKVGSYTGIAIRRDGSFLTMRFKQKNERLWRFAGGKVEPGEPLLIAAARELKEELGVETTHFRLVDTHTNLVDGGIWIGYFFLTEYDDLIGVPKVMEPEKHGDLMLLTPTDLEDRGANPEAPVAFKINKEYA